MLLAQLKLQGQIRHLILRGKRQYLANLNKVSPCTCSELGYAAHSTIVALKPLGSDEASSVLSEREKGVK